MDKNEGQPPLKMGDLTRQAGVSARAVRHYERLGLLRPAGRTPSGYRYFTEDAVQRVLFIRQAQSLGFSLGAIRSLLKAQSIGDPDCNQARAQIAQRLEEIDYLLATARRQQPHLLTLAGICERCQGPCKLQTAFSSLETSSELLVLRDLASAGGIQSGLPGEPSVAAAMGKGREGRPGEMLSPGGHGALDITEAFARLEDLEQALNQGVALSIADVDGRILEVNDGFCALSGYPRESLVGQTYRLLNSGYHPSSFFTDLWSTIQSGRIWRGEIRDLAKDGRIYWVDTVIVPRLDDEGNLERFTCIGLDITTRKAVEAELAASEARLSMALEAAKAGYWDWNLATNQSFRSPRMNQLLGMEEAGKPDDFGPMSWINRVHPEDISTLKTELIGHLAKKKPNYSTYFRLRKEEDRWVHLESRGQVVEWDSDGAPLRMIGLLLDRSEQQHQEDALRETQKLESLGVMAAGIAHDINNFLQALVIHADLAEFVGHQGGDPGQHFNHLREAGLRSQALLRHLTAFARKGEVVSEVLDFDKLVMEMGDLLRMALPSKARLEVERGEGPLLVWGCNSQLEQVLLNLVTNAGEALGQDGGTITLRTSKISERKGAIPSREFSPDLPSGDYALLEVQDTGCGMKAELLDQIFQPFFTTKRMGRGLGLAAMRNIVRDHGGILNVQSHPGEGTCFRIWLPLVEMSSEPDLTS